MRCRRCRQIGHNVRKCTMAAGDGAGTVNTRTVNAGENAGDNFSIPQDNVDANVTDARSKRTRRNWCGHCAQLGHTARTCLIQRGVQAAVVDQNTSRRVRHREERAVMGGVGVYNNSEMGNMYYRV
ncbi:hypothetical protein LINGRAHAP2_LOCUS32521 [Linum grandiflorum]